MKGGLAVLLRLAEELAAGASAALRRARSSSTRARRSPSEFNGLRHVFAEQPDLARRRLRGAARAHRRVGRGRLPGHAPPARPLRRGRGPTRPGRGWGATPSTGPRRCWRAWPRTSPTTVDVDGLPYRESLQVVRIEGGVANNVVPDGCSLVVNRRFAPRYTVDEAIAQVEALLEGADEIEVLNASPAAPPEPLAPAGRRARRRHRARRAAEAGLDRRRPLRRARHARRSTSVPAIRRSRTPRASTSTRDVARRLLRGARLGSSASVPEPRASEPAQDGDDLAVDRDLATGRRPCPPCAAFAGRSTILSRLRRNVLTVASSPGMPATTMSPFSAVVLLAHDDVVAVEDAGVDHRVAADPQHEELRRRR